MYCLAIDDSLKNKIKELNYIPVGLGDNKFSEDWLRDNTGKNISQKNKHYGEYTFHYWLWKNYLHKIKDDNWIGFCGYRYFWNQKKDGFAINTIKKMSKKEMYRGIILFAGSLLFVLIIYQLFDKWSDWASPADAFTSSLFFVAMWLMARRKIEHWILWIVGDIISIPLYIYKGLALTSIQYLIFTLIAIFGYIQWKRCYNKNKRIV